MRPEAFKADDVFAHIQKFVGWRRSVGLRGTAEAADRAKSQLLAAAAEELQAPIESVVTLIQLLTPPARSRRSATTPTCSRRSARGLLWVIDDCLDLTCVEVARLGSTVRRSIFAVLDEVRYGLGPRQRQGLVSGIDIGALARPHHRRWSADRQVLMSLIDTTLNRPPRGSSTTTCAARSMSTGSGGRVRRHGYPEGVTAGPSAPNCSRRTRALAAAIEGGMMLRPSTAAAFRSISAWRTALSSRSRREPEAPRLARSRPWAPSECLRGRLPRAARARSRYRH